ELERTAETYEVLVSEEHELMLRAFEDRGEPMDERRRDDAAERDQLQAFLFGDRSWHEAGRAWARDFGQLPPRQLIDLLAHRHPQGRCEEMLRGAEERLAELAERRSSAGRAGAAVRLAERRGDRSSPPAPAPGAR